MAKFDDIKTKFRNTQYDYDRWISLSSDTQRDIRKHHRDSYRGYKEAFSLRNKYGDNFTYSNYKLYLASRRYNLNLFFQLLLKIFVVFAPLIIISIILSADNFKFDFYQFVNRFSDMQFSLSSAIFQYFKDSKEVMSNELSWVSQSGNPLEWLANIGRMLGNLGIIISWFFALIGLVFTLIIDLLSNVFSFIGALVPSMSF